MECYCCGKELLKKNDDKAFMFEGDLEKKYMCTEHHIDDSILKEYNTKLCVVEDGDINVYSGDLAKVNLQK